MPGRSIDVQVGPAAVRGSALARKVSEVCTVDGFGQSANGTLCILEPKLDECVVLRRGCGTRVIGQPKL